MSETKITISTSITVPKHTQIYNQIKHFILSGQWQTGTKIPSELELSTELGISRGTIRLALKSLEADGLIARAAGRGSFVEFSEIEKNKSRLIGYVTLEFANDFQYQLFRGAESAVSARGYRLVFCLSKKSLVEENQIIKELMADRVNGILIYPALDNSPDRVLKQLTHPNSTPIVLMDRMVEGMHADFVSSDNYQGAFEAVQYLINLGHKKIVFITNPVLSLFPIAERLRGYQAAMERSGLSPYEPFLIGRPDEEMWWENAIDGYHSVYKREIEQIVSLLKSPNRPTAIFAMNQVVAILVQKAVHQLKLEIPKEISLICFDESDLMYNMEKPLSSVNQFPYHIGKRSAELIIERIEGYSGPFRKEHTVPKLQIRTSTSIPIK